MDRILGNTLLGSINGTVLGGAFLTTGKLNNALHLDGVNQEVRFGRYTARCFHIPDRCATGSTFAYWLKWRLTPIGPIFDSGGYFRDSRGYTHVTKQNGQMMVFVKDATHYYNLQTPAGYLRQDKWVYVVQTWSPLSSGKLYINGCQFGKIGFKINRTNAYVRILNFVIGSTGEAQANGQIFCWTTC